MMLGRVKNRLMIISLLVLVLALALACEGKNEMKRLPEVEKKGKRIEDKKIEPFHVEDKFYDQDGMLFDSKKTIHGLHLPIGLKLKSQTETEYIYETSFPIGKILRFFAPKLNAKDVEKIGEGAIYREAEVIGNKEKNIFFNISVFSLSPSGAYIKITVINRNAEVLPLTKERMKALEESYLNLD